MSTEPVLPASQRWKPIITADQGTSFLTLAWAAISHGWTTVSLRKLSGPRADDSLPKRLVFAISLAAENQNFPLPFCQAILAFFGDFLQYIVELFIESKVSFCLDGFTVLILFT